VRDALESAKKKMVAIFNHKEKLEDQAEFLIDDRSSGPKDKKYQNSITSFLDQAKGLEKAFYSMHDKMRNIGE
jgi:hypothetical protein